MIKLKTALLMLCILFLNVTFAGSNSSTTINGAQYRYTVNSRGVVINTIHTSSKDLSIPDHISGKTVYAIAENAMIENEMVVTLAIPDSVQEIGAQAFLGCSALKSVTMGNGVKTIEHHTFYRCPLLSEVNLPAKLETIAFGAFERCTCLQAITLPETLKTLGDNVFTKCALEAITMPESLETIGEDVFSYNFALKKVVLNEGLKSIGSRAFANSALEAVTLPSSVTFVGEKAFCYDQEMTAFNFNDAIPEISFRTFSETFNLKQMQIPDSVTSLDGLEDMTRLRSIYIPDSVTSFGTVGLSHYYTIEPVQYLIYTPEGSPAEQWAKEKRYFVIYADALPAASTASESPQTVLQTVPENGLVALDATFFPDPIFLSYVTQFDSDADGYLSVAECSAVTSVAVPAMNISSLYGIQYFKNLTFLDCHFNGLTALDISENKALKTLWCSYNALNTLNVAQNTALSTLWASRNQLQTIDLTHNPQLRSLSIGQNELTAIDLSALPVLAQLSCSNNHLSLLNTTANPELLWIDCFDNQLRALDVSQNPKLITLNAAYNQIVTMHTDNCPNLQNLNIGQNRDTLIAFDVSKNKALSYLHISDNYHLKEADLSNQTELSTLLCSALDESFKFTINQESPLFFMSDLETRTMTKVFTTKGMQKMAYEGDGVFVDIRCETGNYAYYHYEYRNAVPFDSTYELNMALEPIVTDEVLPAFSLNFYHYVDGDSTLSIAIDNARILLPDGTTIYLWDADRTFILPIEQNTWDNVRYAFGSQYFNFPYEMTSEQLQGGVFKADIKVNPQ